MASDAGAGLDGAGGPDEREIRAVVARLGRPHPSGGTVIERAALLAEGADFDATIAWIVSHGGQPETSAAPAPQRGLHGSRSDGTRGGAGSRTPRRFVVPPGALED